MMSYIIYREYPSNSVRVINLIHVEVNNTLSSLDYEKLYFELLLEKRTRDIASFCEKDSFPTFPKDKYSSSSCDSIDGSSLELSKTL